jgi:hypothetical protein
VFTSPVFDPKLGEVQLQPVAHFPNLPKTRLGPEATGSLSLLFEKDWLILV